MAREAMSRRGRKTVKFTASIRMLSFEAELNDEGISRLVSGYSIAENSITCLRCGMTSQNPSDVENLYCGHCHVFHDGNSAQHQPRFAAGEFAVLLAFLCGVALCTHWTALL